MYNKLGIRALALVLAMAMVFGLVPAAAAAPVQSGGTAYQTLADYLAGQKIALDQVDPDREVDFIVELEDAPLTEALSGEMTLADYLATRRGEARAKAIAGQQQIMAAAIERCADVQILQSYRVVLNGFAVRGKLGDRAALEALDGVKRVAVATTYSVPERMEAEGELVTSGELIHADAVNAEGYTGKGTFAAVLDTGLKVDHEAFVGGKVTDPRITAQTIAAVSGLNATGQLYKNAKVAFAYDYADRDDDVSDAEGHGTHVAGTVAANGDSFVGVAPDAQLAIMKVFSDEGGASDVDIYSALEDCVLLGVDSINMSLGTPSGFTAEDNTITDAVYNAVRNAGISLLVSAGNDYDSAFMNEMGTDLPLVANPDYGIVGSPSTYSAALSVASINEALAYASFFMAGEEKVLYDESPEAALPLSTMDGEYEYVVIGGVGNANDFARVDVAGKVALVERGETAFTEKEQNAYDAGAVAMLVYNNSPVEETVYMQLNGLIPAVFLSQAEGRMLKDAAEKTVTFSPDFSGRMENPVAGQMSDFSSLGCAPDLSIKPEITAPGGSVWSASISGGYEEMSGTSMAAPHMTGAAALLRQYVAEAFPELSKLQQRALIDNLILSTAEPVIDPNGVAYSVRKQGAGLADLSAAIHAGAYLTVDGGKPKAELGDSEEGSYTFTVTVHNVSAADKTYALSLDAIVAETEEVYGELCISQLCRTLTADELTVSFSEDAVTVPAGGTADVTVSLALTEAGKENLAVFPNGIYIEGFLRLTGEDVTALGLPVLGFYGDWADAPIFDSTMYDDQAPFMADGAMAMLDYNGSGNYLGVNAVTGNANADWISYPSRSAGYMLVTPMLGLLRAPKEIRYTAVSDADPDTLVYEAVNTNAVKSFYYTSGGFIYTDYVNWADAWQPIGGNDADGYYYLDDGPFTYTVSARIDGEEDVQSIDFPVFIDNQAPTVVSHTYEVIDGTPWLTIAVTDNHYIMAAQLVNEAYTAALSPILPIEETELGAVTELRFDLTDVQAEGHALCRVVLYDYAWNEGLSDGFSTTSQDVEPIVVTINNYAVTANVDSSNMEMTAFIDPVNAVNRTLTWTSTDENVARVVSVSEDTLSAEIDFVGPGSCEIHATAVNGVKGVATVRVAKPKTDWPADNVIRQDGFYTIPENLNTTVTITDEAQNVWLTGAAANTQAAPYQNLSFKSENEALHLTIENLHLVNSLNYKYNAGIVFTGKGNVLTLVGENSVKQADYGSNASISVAEGVELTINGEGKLTLLGNHNAYGASIGGDAGKAAGTIVIDSGNFVVDKTNNGAAIGGGANHAGCKITVNGGSFDIQVPSAQSGYSYNTSATGAVIGSGNTAKKGTAFIVINGGSFVGYTQTNSAIIGGGHRGEHNLIVDINGGSFDLLSEDVSDGLVGGACIGTGHQYNAVGAVDITINGGEIIAVSKSSAAAIGGGAGMPGGNIYINGGTVTAACDYADAVISAIGDGSNPLEGSDNIRISGGTVKAVATGTGKTFSDETLVNADSDKVFLVNLTAPNVEQVTVNGEDWHISANHPADDQLYLYLPASENAYEVEAGDQGWLVTVSPSGEITVEEQAKADKSDLLLTISMVEKLDSTEYTQDSWAELEAALEAARAVAEDPNATQDEVLEATRNLNIARELLIRRGDLTELNELYEAVMADWERMASNVYPDEVVDAFLESYSAAGLFLYDAAAAANYTQEDVDAVYADLLAAYEALLAYPVNSMYTDVPEDEWYYAAVDFATRYGFMNGMDGGAFNAAGTVNRAQFVTILYRIAGEPAVSGTNPFEDVKEGTWYTDAAVWAYENGITTGVDATHFNPGGTLVRQNMVTFLMRFAKVMGVDTTKRADLSGYTDADQVMAHAKDAMEWAVAEGVISGMSATTLGPNGLANRAQIATIIQRFVKNFLW